MTDIKRFNTLKRQVDDKKRELDRAEGALEETMRRLKKDFGCNTLKEAKAKLAALRTKTNQANERFANALNTFERKWGKALETAKDED